MTQSEYPQSAPRTETVASGEQKPTMLERIKAHRRKIGATAALIATLTGSVAACGNNAEGTNNAPTPNSPTIGAPVTPGSPEKTTPPKSSVSEAERNFATYFETLNPEQQAVRKSLSPENIATLSPDQITNTFKIPAGEVKGSDGKINPELYAEAYAARSEGLFMGGCAPETFQKWGGVDAVGGDKVKEIANTYVDQASTAFLGYAAGHDPSIVAISKCVMTDTAIEYGLPPKRTERYNIRVTPDVKSITRSVKPDGSTNIYLLYEFHDNYMSNGDVGDLTQTSETDTVTLTGIKETPDGSVLPATVEVHRL